MKKIIISLLVMATLVLTGCNYNFVDTEWQFNYAYITLNNGKVLEVEIDSWAEDETSVTIKGKDGNNYCVSMMNCTLTKDRLE